MKGILLLVCFVFLTVSFLIQRTTNLSFKENLTSIQKDLSLQNSVLDCVTQEMGEVKRQVNKNIDKNCDY